MRKRASSSTGSGATVRCTRSAAQVDFLQGVTGTVGGGCCLFDGGRCSGVESTNGKYLAFVG